MNTTVKRLLAAGAIVGGLVLLDSLFLEKYFFNIKRFRIGKLNGGKSVKIALLTDLHFKHKLRNYHKKLARKINELKPGLLLIGGDTLDTHGTTAPAEDFLHLLDDNISKAAILGNHDHLAKVNNTDLEAMYRSYGVDLLVNRSKVFEVNNERIMITGLDDFIEGDASFEKAIENVKREKHHFLLIHSPLQQEGVIRKMKQLNTARNEADQLNICYIFAGHNHGGQVRLFNLVPILPEKSGKYINGWYNNKPPYLYLSKGFGTSGVPFRFMARSELVLFDYYL